MRKIWISMAVLLAACTAPTPGTPPAQTQAGAAIAPTDAPTDAPLEAPAQPQPAQANLKDLGPAPELENGVWLNVDQPLRLAGLRGKVVLLEMWTFG